MSAQLEVDALKVTYGEEVEALSGVDLSLQAGESIAVVGENGAGKSTLGRALTGLLGPARAMGSVRFEGRELLGMAEEELRLLRWRQIAYAPQGAAFNPVIRLEAQLLEPLVTGLGVSRGAAALRVGELAGEIGLEPLLLRRYPHEVSGGQRRLALLTMVLAGDPALLVLDEPTAGLDALVARRVMARLRALIAERQLTLVVISHDLPAVTRICARTLVLYAGRAAETGATDRVIARPTHPYTWGLLNSYPVINTGKDVRPIRGLAPDARALPPGCRFHPRCTQAEAICKVEVPPLERHRGRRVACLLGGIVPVVALESVVKGYQAAGVSRGARQIALNGVSIEVRSGEVTGCVGRSGSGKSTLAQIAAGLLRPDSGCVRLSLEQVGRREPGDQRPPGIDFWSASEVTRRRVRRRAALIFQDPVEALSPRLPIADLVREPLDVTAAWDADERRQRSLRALERVGLEPRPGLLRAYAHELSGGQQQRVAIARAIVSEPRLLIADEPTSMLDASEQARVLTLLKELQVELGTAMIFISHDIAVVRKIADRIVVLDAGRVVEEGPSGVVSTSPASPLAQRLVQAAPTLEADGGRSFDQQEPADDTDP